MTINVTQVLFVLFPTNFGAPLLPKVDNTSLNNFVRINAMIMATKYSTIHIALAGIMADLDVGQLKFAKRIILRRLPLVNHVFHIIKMLRKQAHTE